MLDVEVLKSEADDDDDGDDDDNDNDDIVVFRTSVPKTITKTRKNCFSKLNCLETL